MLLYNLTQVLVYTWFNVALQLELDATATLQLNANVASAVCIKCKCCSATWIRCNPYPNAALRLRRRHTRVLARFYLHIGPITPYHHVSGVLLVSNAQYLLTTTGQESWHGYPSSLYHYRSRVSDVERPQVHPIGRTIKAESIPIGRFPSFLSPYSATTTSVIAIIATTLSTAW